MCGRYRLAKDWTQIERRFGAKLADAVKPLEPRFNIAPTDEVVAIRRRKDHEQPEAELLRWGLIQHWAKDTKSAWQHHFAAKYGARPRASLNEQLVDHAGRPR